MPLVGVNRFFEAEVQMNAAAGIDDQRRRRQLRFGLDCVDQAVQLRRVQIIDVQDQGENLFHADCPVGPIKKAHRRDIHVRSEARYFQNIFHASRRIGFSLGHVGFFTQIAREKEVIKIKGRHFSIRPPKNGVLIGKLGPQLF